MCTHRGFRVCSYRGKCHHPRDHHHHDRHHGHDGGERVLQAFEEQPC